jgi:adenylate kinase
VRIVLLGAPGSGKGTQGVPLAEHYGVPHVSSGELMRSHVADGTDVGRLVSGYLARGELVPDDLTIVVVGDAVRDAMKSGGYVLDGFPRTLEQAQRAYAFAEPAGAAADAVIYLAVPDDIARERLAARSGTGRADDADSEVIERRLRVFHAETEPLLDFYRDRGILVSIDAVGSPDDVRAAIFDALAARDIPSSPTT